MAIVAYVCSSRTELCNSRYEVVCMCLKESQRVIEFGKGSYILVLFFFGNGATF